MKNKMIEIIKLYKRVVSPLLAQGVLGFRSGCRFYPSCSDYAIDSISKYGIGKGSLKAITRILKCNPFVKPMSN